MKNLLIAILISLLSFAGFNAQQLKGKATISGKVTTGTQSIPTGAFASTSGTSGGNGSISSPWDLKTALEQDTTGIEGATGNTADNRIIYLRGGTYSGKWIVNNSGTSGNPIIIKSYPGEWAVIDGYYTTTLTGSMTNTSSPTTVTVADPSKFADGSDWTCHLPATQGQDEEVLRVQSRVGNSVTFLRGLAYNGASSPTSTHASTDVLVMGGTQLNITADDVIVRDLEIKNSDTHRIQSALGSQNAPHFRSSGINLASGADRIKVINCVIHDTQEGVFAAPGIAEFYGNILYYSGYVAGGVYNGHGFYLQNTDGANPKLIHDNITLNAFAIGIKAESQSANSIGLSAVGNISFNNGSPNGSLTSRRGDILMGANGGSADALIIDYCYVYDPTGAIGGGIFIDYANTGSTGSLTNSHIAAGARDSQFKNSTSGLAYTISGNRFDLTDGAGEQFVLFDSFSATLTATNNAYNNQTPTSNPFNHNGTNRTFASWQGLGYDPSPSTYSTSSPPDAVYVRPNAYETGRAHIAIFNYSLASSVTVNVSSILTVGDAYFVYAAENPFGAAVASGTFGGTTISIPMSGSTVVAPVGVDSVDIFTPDTMRPIFGAFILVKSNSPFVAAH